MHSSVKIQRSKGNLMLHHTHDLICGANEAAVSVSVLGRDGGVTHRLQTHCGGTGGGGAWRNCLLHKLHNKSGVASSDLAV